MGLLSEWGAPSSVWWETRRIPRGARAAVAGSTGSGVGTGKVAAQPEPRRRMGFHRGLGLGV